MKQRPQREPLTKEEQQRIRARQNVRHRTEPRPECEVCGATPSKRHHIDWADPERVMNLCKRCHEAYHSQFGKPPPADWMADIRAAMRRINAKRASLRAAQSSRASDGLGKSGQDLGSK
jgi:ribosome-binding protein aMBF1 (putative translation factor)